jgi:hypothetical protein
VIRGVGHCSGAGAKTHQESFATGCSAVAIHPGIFALHISVFTAEIPEPPPFFAFVYASDSGVLSRFQDMGSFGTSGAAPTPLSYWDSTSPCINPNRCLSAS